MHRILGLNGHITVYSGKSVMKDFSAVQEYIVRDPFVTQCSPIIEKQGLFLAQGASGGIIRGIIPSASYHQNSLLSKSLLQGSIMDMETPYTVIIGHKLAKKIHMRVGDRMKIMVAQNRPTVMGFLPRSRSFRVVGIFDTGMHEYDQAFVFMSLATAQKFWDMPSDTVTHMEIFVKDPENIDNISRHMGIQLAEGFPHEELLVYDWQKANAHFFNAIQVQRNVLFLILLLIILVAVFNIVACLIMLVQDKIKDIAVLRTLGATRGAILGIFLRVGAFIGGVGTLVGTIIGLSFSYYIDHIRRFLEFCSGAELFQAEIYFLSKLPVQIRGFEVFLVAFVTIGLSFVASFYPAWKASRLHPVEGLRYE